MAVGLVAGQPIEGESKNAVIACNDYVRMGPGRTLTRLVQTYAETNSYQPPTRHLATLKEWSTKYAWQARAAAYDAAIDAEKTARNEARRQAIMESGLALDYERVNELTEIYEKLKLEFITGGLWYTDTKLSSTGATVDVDVFNKSLIDSLRGALDDLAKETGGRKQKAEISGPNGGPIETKHATDLTDEELAAIAIRGGGGTPKAQTSAA